MSADAAGMSIEQQNAIVKIQALVRGHLARKERLRLLQEKFEEQERVFEERQRQEIEEGLRELEQQQAREKAEEEALLRKSDSIVSEYAAMIQRAFRRWHTHAKRQMEERQIFDALAKSHSLSELPLSQLHRLKMILRQRVINEERDYACDHHYQKPGFSEKLAMPSLKSLYIQYKAVSLEIAWRDGSWKPGHPSDLKDQLRRAEEQNDAAWALAVRRVAKDTVIHWEGWYALAHNGTLPDYEARLQHRTLYSIIRRTHRFRQGASAAASPPAT